jgi:hypothetical protein
MATFHGMGAIPYRIPEPKPPAPPVPDPYMRAWQRLRMWRTLSLLGMVLWLGIMFIAAPLLERWCIPLAWPVMVLLAISSCGATWFACPRCGECFGSQHWFWGPHWPSLYFRRNCLHCGIAIGTLKGTSGSDSQVHVPQRWWRDIP